jgi:xylulokinase
MTVGEACTRPRIIDSIEPEPALADRLAPKLAIFRRAYPALRDL